MQIRSARAGDLPRLAALAEHLQARPDRYLPYLSREAAAITAELEELDEWTAVSAACSEAPDGPVTGWLVGELDPEIGRVWWLGPFVADASEGGADWAPAATALYAHAHALLPEEITEEEFAITPEFVELEHWALDRGFNVDPGSVALATIGPVDAREIVTREVVGTDLESVGALHDRLFPGSHYTGRQIVEGVDGAGHAPGHRRLAALIDDVVVGYVAAERQADGSGYIDFLGVDDAHRRRGLGASLIAAAAGQLRAAGCQRLHLTVREANHGARALYRSLGFEEEVVLRPLRRGFTLA